MIRRKAFFRMNPVAATLVSAGLYLSALLMIF